MLRDRVLTESEVIGAVCWKIVRVVGSRTGRIASRSLTTFVIASE